MIQNVVRARNPLYILPYDVTTIAGDTLAITNPSTSKRVYRLRGFRQTQSATGIVAFRILSACSAGTSSPLTPDRLSTSFPVTTATGALYTVAPTVTVVTTCMRLRTGGSSSTAFYQWLRTMTPPLILPGQFLVVNYSGVISAQGYILWEEIPI